MARQTRVSRRKNQEIRFENGRGIFGTNGREICVKFLGTVNHRPKFFANFAPNFAQNSAPRKRVFRAQFRARFRACLGTASRFPLRSLSAFETPRDRSSLEAQTSRSTPSSSLVVCHHLEASHYHMCDQDERQR